MSPARAILFAAFFVAGAATTMLSPLLPLFQSRWRVDDASLGLLFTAQFVSSFCTSALASRLAARFAWGTPA